MYIYFSFLKIYLPVTRRAKIEMTFLNQIKCVRPETALKTEVGLISSFAIFFILLQNSSQGHTN